MTHSTSDKEFQVPFQSLLGLNPTLSSSFSHVVPYTTDVCQLRTSLLTYELKFFSLIIYVHKT